MNNIQETIKTKYSKDIEETLFSSQKTELRDMTHEKRKTEIENFKTDIALKKRYANYFIGILIGQLILMNVIFFLSGLGCLKYNYYALNIYISGTLAEIFGVVFIITRYLFSKNNHS